MLKGFLRRPSNAFLIAVCISLAIALASVALSPQTPFNQCPSINTKQNSEKTIQPQQNPSGLEAPVNGAGCNDGQNRGNEATEYWTIFGRRLKITDTLLVLFAFTLWWATYRLVVTHEDTATQQLRAYVHVEDVVMSNMNAVNRRYAAIVQVIIKNFGQTPARQITNTFWCGPIADAQESSFGLDTAQTVELHDLGPTQKTFSTFFYPLALLDFWKQPIETGGMIFYVFGRIDYYDAFGKRWFTEYRYQLTLGESGIPNERSLSIVSGAGNRTT